MKQNAANSRSSRFCESLCLTAVLWLVSCAAFAQDAFVVIEETGPAYRLDGEAELEVTGLPDAGKLDVAIFTDLSPITVDEQPVRLPDDQLPEE